MKMISCNGNKKQKLKIVKGKKENSGNLKI
jgi:hypothetical protein